MNKFDAVCGLHVFCAAVDLVPIRPIAGSGSEVILMQGDITTDKTRAEIEGFVSR